VLSSLSFSLSLGNYLLTAFHPNPYLPITDHSVSFQSLCDL